MLESLARVRMDPKFRALPIPVQISVARRIAERDLQTDQRFTALNPQLQQDVLTNISFEVPTFSDQETEQRVTGFARSYLAGGAGARKQAQEFLAAMVLNSGVIGFVDQHILGGQARVEDRRRALQYYTLLDQAAGRSDIAGEAGALAGVVADIAAVSLATSPITAAARTAVGAAARGVSASTLATATRTLETAERGLIAAKRAKVGVDAARAAVIAAEKAMPAIVNRSLATLGPVAAESLVEMIPYFLADEQRRAQQGLPSVTSEGVGSVLSTLGMNAAMDFAVGTALGAALRFAARTGKAVFRKTDIFDTVIQGDEEFKVYLRQLRSGTASPEIYEQLDDIGKASVKQYMAMADYLEEGLLDASSDGLGKIAWLSHDTGRISEAIQDASGAVTGFRVWEFAEDGRARIRQFAKVQDLEDYLSYRFYNANQKAVETYISKNPGITQQDALAKLLRPQNAWGYIRGRTLALQEGRFSVKALADSDPDYAAWLGKQPKSWADPLNRPILSKAEADYLGSQPGGIAIQTQVPLRGSIVEAANAGDIRLMRGAGPQVIRKSDAPNALFVGTSAAPQEAYDLATAEAHRLVSVEPFRTLEDARASLLLNRGFDYYANPDGSFEFFTSRNMKLIGTPDDVILPTKKATVFDTASSSAVVSEKGRFLLRGVSLGTNQDVVLEGAVKALRSSNPEDLRNFSRLYFKAAGVPTDVKIRMVGPNGKVATRQLSDGLIEVDVPRSTGSFKKESQVIEDFFRELNSRAAFEGVSPRATLMPGDFYADALRKAPLRFGFPSGVDPTSWLEASLEKLGGKLSRVDGKFRIDLPSGPRTFDTIQGAVDFMARRAVDPASAVNDLLQSGIRVSRIPSGGYIATSLNEGKVLARGAALEDILNELDYAPKALDRSYGPTNVEITPDGIAFDLGRNVYFKDRKTALQTLGAFKDQKLLNERRFIKVSEKGDLSEIPGGSFRVYNPRLDFIRYFDSLPEARKYLESTVTYDTLQEIAERKFADFRIEEGQFVVRAGPQKFIAKDTAELEKILKDLPDVQESVPDLIRLDPEVEIALPQLLEQFQRKNTLLAGPNRFNQPPEFDLPEKIRNLSLFHTANQVTSPFFDWADSVAKELDLAPLRTINQKYKLAMRRVALDQTRASRILEGIFRGPDGKFLSIDSRRKIFYHMSAEASSDEAKKLAEMYTSQYGIPLGPLTEAEQLAATRLRQFYDALGDKFGIDYNKLIHFYMPRLRKAYHELPEAAKEGLVSMKDLIRKVPDWATEDLIPKELKFFAENERIAEIPQFWLKDDALEVSLLYSAQGHKKLYLNPVFQEQNRLFTEAGERMPAAVRARYEFFKADIMGANQTRGEKVVASFGESFFRALAESPVGKALKMDPNQAASVGRNTLNNVLGLTYFSSMGWKPFLAIRNSFQPMTTLAMRVGSDWTMKAYAAVGKDPERYYGRLRQLGVLSEKPPIVNLVWSDTSAVGRFVQKSFGMFKNSDDYTRAVAYVAAEMRFDNAMKLRAVNPSMTPAKLMEEIGLDRVPPEIAEQAASLIQKGTDDALLAARDLYANHIQRVTMFDYSGAASPMLYRGVIGKLFGQFGTYSANFRANIAEALRYGTPGQKLQSIATYLAFTSALAVGFKSLGVKTNDFTPFLGAVFTGGPGFDIAVNVMKSFDTGFEGEQARAALKRDYKALLPGSSQAVYLGRAIEAIEAGDMARALAAVSMVPLEQK